MKRLNTLQKIGVKILLFSAGTLVSSLIASKGVYGITWITATTGLAFLFSPILKKL